MHKQPCEHYTEWMSLAQDGILNSTQSHLLHTHLATCAPCRTQWEAMATVSRMLHAAPIVSPEPGFVARFEARLAYRKEQRRQGMVWLLLGIGVIALTILALPSLIRVLSLTSRMVLPYDVIVYLQRLFDWAYIVFSALMDAAGVLMRHFVTTPAGLACIGSVVAAGLLMAAWTRMLVHRMSAESAG